MLLIEKRAEVCLPALPSPLKIAPHRPVDSPTLSPWFEMLDESSPPSSATSGPKRTGWPEALYDMIFFFLLHFPPHSLCDLITSSGSLRLFLRVRTLSLLMRFANAITKGPRDDMQIEWTWITTFTLWWRRIVTKRNPWERLHSFFS